MKYLAPHVYLTRPSAAEESYQLRIMVPHEANHQVLFPTTTSANGGMVRQIHVQVEPVAGLAAGTAVQEYTLQREPGGAPGVESEEEVHVIVELLDPGTAQWSTTGVRKAHYHLADDRVLGPLAPCVYLTKPNGSVEHHIHTMIHADGYVATGVNTQSQASNSTFRIRLNLGDDASANGPVVDHQQFEVDENGIVVITWNQGAKKGEDRITSEDTDDKPNTW